MSRHPLLLVQIPQDLYKTQQPHEALTAPFSGYWCSGRQVIEDGQHALPFCISSLCLGGEQAFVKSGDQILTSQQAQVPMGMNAAVWVTAQSSIYSWPDGGPQNMCPRIIPRTSGCALIWKRGSLQK